MDKAHALVAFGDTEISEGIIHAHTKHGVDITGSARIVMENDVFSEHIVDFTAEARIYAIRDKQQSIIFTGVVDEVIPGPFSTEIKFITTNTILNEIRMGGLGIGGQIHGPEVLWSILRAAGVPENRISVEGFERRPLEVFEVASAVDGVKLSTAISMGSVRIVPASLVSQLADGLGPDELLERYRDASCWALTLTTATTLFDAESEGLKAIDLALAWLTVRTQYTSATLHKNQPRRYHRSWTRSHVSRRDIVAVRGLATGRRWLRAPADLPNRPILQLEDIEDLLSIPLPIKLSQELSASISAWRRALDDPSLLSSVVALWESIEFYVAGVYSDELFDKHQRSAIRARALNGLEGAQRERVEHVLAMLNQLPLMARLRLAIKADHVPITEAEIALLARVRKIRNGLVHGRSSEERREEDVKYAIALVNRMLVCRVRRLTGSSDKLSEARWHSVEAS